MKFNKTWVWLLFKFKKH